MWTSYSIVSKDGKELIASISMINVSLSKRFVYGTFVYLQSSYVAPFQFGSVNDSCSIANSFGIYLLHSGFWGLETLKTQKAISVSDAVNDLKTFTWSIAYTISWFINFLNFYATSTRSHAQSRIYFVEGIWQEELFSFRCMTWKDSILSVHVE